MKLNREDRDGAKNGSGDRDATAPGKSSRTERMPGISSMEASAIQMAGLQPRSMTSIIPISSGVEFVDTLIGPANHRTATEDERAVQRRGTGEATDVDVHAAAAAGVQGPGGSLPFMDVIQQSFGEHDVSGIQAHVGGQAATAARNIGADAYATGNDVGFARAPDLHTAAHEAAHVVQQRAGVQLKGGVGTTGDPYERHADAVADAVVRGESAAPLLGPTEPHSRSGGRSLQLRRTDEALPPEARAQTPEQRQIIEAVQRLQTAEDRAERVWSNVDGKTIEPDAACTTLAGIVGGALPAVMVLSGLLSRAANERTAVDEALDPANPFKMGRAANDADKLETLTSAADYARPEAFDSLNNLARLSMQTMRLASEGSERRSLASMVDTVSSYASPMGWNRPADLGEAVARRFAHEACPDGAAEERPDVCTMNDAERVGVRVRIVKLVGDVIDAFFAACEVEKDAIKAMIDADRAIGEFVGGVAVEMIMGAVTGGASAGKGEAAMTAAEAVGEGAKATVRRAPDLKKIADKFSKYAGKAGTMKLPGGKYEVAEERTMDAIGELQDAFKVALGEVEALLEEFDDLSLRELVGTLTMFNAEAATTRVKRFVASYRSQIEPIGTRDPLFAQSQPLGWRDLPGEVTMRAARIHPLRGKPRMALVRQVTDAIPEIRAGGRAVADIAAAGVRALDRAVNRPDDRRGAAPATAANPPEPSTARPGSDPDAEQFHFVRWIDDDMAPLADAEAIDLSSTVVHGVTWAAGVVPDDQPSAAE